MLSLSKLLQVVAFLVIPRLIRGAIDGSLTSSSSGAGRRGAQEISPPDGDAGRYYKSSDFEPINDNNIDHAVEQWLTNRTGATIQFGPIEEWDVSEVTSMYNLFKDAGTFNDDISKWDVSSVTSMHGMFWGANSFNKDISPWQVDRVDNMYSMFRDAFRFNQSLSPWDTGKVINMASMFFNAGSMQADLSGFDTSSVETMDMMFQNTNFNGDIAMWDVGSLFTSQSMFEGNPVFNCDIGDWNTKNLELFERMFFDATSFHQKLCWDIQETKVANFQVFCNSEGKFDPDCVGEKVLIDANRRCIGALEEWLQSWIDFFDEVVMAFEDFIEFFEDCFEAIGNFTCFAPDALTPVEYRGMVAMKDLKVGDKVLTASGHYQAVYSMFHYDKKQPTPYLQIHTAHSHNHTGRIRPIELTPNHLIHVVGYENPIPAWQVKVGDYLYVAEPQYAGARSWQQLQRSKVIQIQKVIRNGLYNPLTEDGTIVVDGIVASAYASFLGTEHIRLFRNSSTSSIATSAYAMDDEDEDEDGWKAMSHQNFVHILLAPYRAVCLYVYPGWCKPPLDGKNGQEDSVWYGRLGQQLLLLWLRQNVVVQAIIFVLLVTIFGLMHMILNPVGVSLMLAAFFSPSVLHRKQSASKPEKLKSS